MSTYTVVLAILLMCSYSNAIVENFYCTDACIGMSVYCYCDTTTTNLDWNITFPNGSEIVSEQFNMISSNHRDTKGFHFVYNNTNSNLTFLLNNSLNIIIKCRNGGEYGSNESIRSIAISDPGPPLQPSNISGSCHNNEITVKWDPVNCSVNYTIVIGNKTYITSSTSLTVPSNGIYNFTVVAIDNIGRFGTISHGHCTLVPSSTITTSTSSTQESFITTIAIPTITSAIPNITSAITPSPINLNIPTGSIVGIIIGVIVAVIVAAIIIIICTCIAAYFCCTHCPDGGRLRG